MKLIGYTTVAVSFLAGWIGVALLVRHWLAEVLPGDYGDLYVQYGYASERHVLTDWLELPGSVIGLPVGCLLACLMAAVLKRKDAR